jgi:hypothetical protein
MRRSRSIGAALACLLLACSGSAKSEVMLFLDLCGAQMICPSYQLVVTPPPGWVIEEEATRRYMIQMLVPKGKTFGNAEALIYVKVYRHADRKQPLADYAQRSNARWRVAVPDSKISRLTDVARANGKPGFVRFAYENPSRPEQAYEMDAFGYDSDKEGHEFVLQVVMSGRAKKQLELAEKDYIAFLKAH